MTLPVGQVLLDDFTGAFPYDITAYVEWSKGLSWSRGRPDEDSDNSAGTLTLTLDNTDGRFTLGSGVYGTGLNQKIRAIVNSTTRFTGRVQGWPVAWPGGADDLSEVQVTAVDDLARLERRALRSSLEEEILADAPTAYYTLGEAAGATQAADSSGNGMPSLTAAGTGTAVVFGNGTGPADGLPASQFAGGQYLTAAASSDYLGSAWTVELWVNIASAPASQVGLFQAQGSTGTNTVEVNTSGQVIAGPLAGPIVGPVVTDGLTHQVVVKYDGAGTTTLYVGGASSGTAGTSFAALNQINVGSVAGGTPLTGTLSHIATYSTALSGARIASHYAAGGNDFLGETPAARITRIAGYAGLTTSGLDTAGSTLMGPAKQQGRSAGDVLAEVGHATLGTVYIDATGALTSVNGYTIVGDTSPDAALDGQVVNGDLAIEADMFGVINSARGNATGSENLTYAQNAFSITVHGVYPGDLEWNVSTDDQARDRTNWMVGTYGGPAPRVTDVSLDVQSMGSTDTAAALTLDLGGFLHLQGLPSQSPGGTVADLIVQEITETISDTEWTISGNYSRHNLYAAWILGDSFWGVLGVTTKLYAA